MTLDSLILSTSQREALEVATTAYEGNIAEAREFLASRGITREVATEYRLGFVDEPAPGHERFVGMLSIPYLTAAGVVKLKFRRLAGEGSKYDGPSSAARLYNTAALLGDEPVVALCEGEFDALVCSALVGVPAVGTPGTQWQDHWSRCFADKDQVLVVADNDVKEDGSNPGMKHALKIAKNVPSGRVVTPPPGEDMNTWVLAVGPDAVREAMGL
ncbi:toprim domain-containing protein [Nocardioides massiliensis]|uniref:DNA primase n=1 Tax=Nocardioides massiliensis TaxID=1325935 RepID=A0ABT9NKD3_9ACTN|nr:toprim domain-containing protein [Nocardioides massiliensis]MDP9820515.1 DNA primase [Nocardioides massiliensis]